MKSNARLSNIELLRILTICGVVVLHYNSNVAFSHVTSGTVNDYLLQLLEVLFICAVDLFVLISGYFLCNSNGRKTVKALELVAQVMVIGVLKYLAATLLSGGPLSLSGLVAAAVPNNYYVTLYLAVYLLSPYINLGLKNLSDRQFSTLLALCLLLFSLWPTVLDTVYLATGLRFAGLYPTNTEGSQYGYSFICFCLMYLLGAYLRRKSSSKVLWDGAGFVICLALLFVWQLFYPPVARSYCNPLVIFMAVFAFRLFTRLRFSSKLVNILAKGAFTCFLLHDFFLKYIGIEAVVNRSLPILLGHILITVPLIFLACWMVWWVYDRLTRPIFTRLGKHLNKLDALLSPEDAE